MEQPSPLAIELTTIVYEFDSADEILAWWRNLDDSERSAIGFAAIVMLNKLLRGKGFLEDE